MELGTKSILITGGLGNLGSWLTQYLCKEGYDVTVLSKRQRKLEFEQRFELILCDIANISDVQENIIPGKYDIIIHAASVNDGFKDNYFHDALIVNTLGTRNILECIKEMPPQHFIYFSTFHVYGKYAGEMTELDPPQPKNDYGATHLFAEYYVKQFHENHNIPYSIIRLSNSYGCPKDYNSSKWYLILNDLSRMAFEQGKIVLNTNGLSSRDFIWMGDVCKIIHELLKVQAPNETFNLSSGNSYSLLDVACNVQKAFQVFFKEDIEIRINHNDKSSPGEPIVINSDKLKQLIPYKAEAHFVEEAIHIFEFLQRKNNHG
jgi:nucleoside-diphosphate-sugar epimerase